MKIGDRIYVRGYVDEIRKDTVIVRNDGGYFGTIPSEAITGELPSAQPERKTGKWIGHSLQNGLYSLDEDTCSVCGHSFYQISETGCLWNYCPHCGAKMEVENETD